MAPSGRVIRWLLVRVLTVLTITILGSACNREPRAEECPRLAAGDLVVSELRGAQSGPDTYGQYIELYNAGTAAIPMAGVSITLTRTDGGDVAEVLVRTRDVTVAPGDYVVLGKWAEGSAPDHVDYAWGDDPSLYSAALVEVRACDVLVDAMVYRSLPAQGSHALDGATSPDATANDVEADWCVDATDPGSTTELGLPGTPGEGNLSCM